MYEVGELVHEPFVEVSEIPARFVPATTGTDEFTGGNTPPIVSDFVSWSWSFNNDPVVVAVRLQVPDVTMVMVPVELPTVHTEVVSDAYTTGSDPVFTAGVTTEAVAPFVRSSDEVAYVHPVKAFAD